METRMFAASASVPWNGGIKKMDNYVFGFVGQNKETRTKTKPNTFSLVFYFLLAALTNYRLPPDGER